MKLLVCDDHRPVRESVRQLIELGSDHEVVGEATDGAEAVSKVEQLRPDVVLMDVNMPVMSGVEATRQIRDRFPEVRVLALTALGDVEHVSSMVSAGASGYILKGGDSRDLLASIEAVASGEGPIDRAVTLDVIRGMAELEDQLRQAQKMESIGQLVSGVAHDFNNLIAVIGNYARMLQEDLPEADPAREDVAEIINASDRATGLVRQLLTFSSGHEKSASVLNMNEEISRLVKLLHRVLGEDIRLRTTLEADLWPIRMDPTQLDQVVLNLAVNARDAMPTGGTLHLSTSNLDLQNDFVQLRHSGTARRFVCLTVADDGPGIPADVVDRIFDPFFTTKPRGKGTGLGLATVQGIVKQALGSIQLDTSPERGTTFRVYLPVADRPADERAVVTSLRRRGAGQTILVVEDDKPLRRVIERILSRSGYVPIVTESVEEARSVLDGEDLLDVLLTDVVMPRSSGTELAAYALDRRPELRVVYMSGYEDQVLMRHGVEETGGFLPKPFGPEQLLDVIARKLDQR